VTAAWKSPGSRESSSLSALRPPAEDAHATTSKAPLPSGVARDSGFAAIISRFSIHRLTDATRRPARASDQAPIRWRSAERASTYNAWR
jgi:hypothetical protein